MKTSKDSYRVRILPACADSCAGGGLANRLALAGGAQSPQLGFSFTHTDGEQPVGVFTAVVLLAALLWC
jgi:trans-2-enoyl-CoA reductase